MASRRALLGAMAVGVGASLALQTYRHPDRPLLSHINLGLDRTYYYGGRILRMFVDAEEGHELAIKITSKHFNKRAICGLIDHSVDGDMLRTTPFKHRDLKSLEFRNPIGLAAGFDKHAEAIDGLLDMGFGFVEIGSVTPLPQPGNEKPRVFRLEEDKAIINRYGFNSAGADAVQTRLAQRLELSAFNQTSTPDYLKPRVLGINLGKNKTSPSANEDYKVGVKKLGHYADYIVVNISSPNTPGLRDLQHKHELRSLLQEVKQERDQLPTPRPPLLVKIAPDLTNEDKQDIADVVLDTKIDGLIISNTTLSRPASLKSSNKTETGGLSGAPLCEMNTALIRDMYNRTHGQVVIIGVGGVSSGAEAYEKIKAGASLVQLYSAFAYDGPKIVPKIKEELKECLARDGFKNVEQAVGVEARR